MGKKGNRRCRDTPGGRYPAQDIPELRYFHFRDSRVFQLPLQHPGKIPLLFGRGGCLTVATAGCMYRHIAQKALQQV